MSAWGREVDGFLWLVYSCFMTKLPEEVREAAAIFGRMGGRAAGKKMTKKARVARARKAARARWEKSMKQSKGFSYERG